MIMMMMMMMMSFMMIVIMMIVMKIEQPTLWKATFSIVMVMMKGGDCEGSNCRNLAVLQLHLVTHVAMPESDNPDPGLS